MSGYTDCACRDCFGIAISNDWTKPDLCADCEDAGCAKNNGDCERSDALADAQDGMDDDDE